MSSVQMMRGLSQSGPQFSSKYMVNGSVPSNLRKPHEVICCAIYIVLAWVLIGSFTLGIKQANPSQFLYPTGQGFRCGFGAAQNYPYAYFYNPLINNKTVCADKCPKMTSSGTVQPIDCYYKFRCSYLTELAPNSQYSPTLQEIKVIGYPTISTVGNLCLPDPSLMNKALKPSGFSLYQKISEQHQKVSVVDLINKYYLILICASAAIFLSVICQLLVRMVYYRNLLWPFLGFSVVLMLGISFTFLYLAGGIYIPLDQYSGYLGLAYYYTQSRYLGLSVFFFALSLLFIFVLALEIYRVKRQIKNIQDYGAIFVPEFTTKQLLLYVGFIIMFLGHWALSIFCFIQLVTSIKIKSEEKYLKMFTETVSEITVQQVLSYFVIFWAIWGGYVIIGFFKTMIALMYTQNGAIQKKQRKNQILQFLVIVFYHHFGTIVASTFFVPIIGSIAQFLIWAFKIDFTKNSFVNPIAKMLKIFNPAVYLHLAITGNNYLTCCKASYNIIWETEKFQEEEQEFLKKIQTQKLLFVSIKTVVSLLCPFIILAILTYSLDFHKQVFEPLWIVVPSWLIGLGVVEILLYGIESQTRIREINNFLLNDGKSDIPLESKKQRRTLKIFPSEYKLNGEQKVQEIKEKKSIVPQNIKKQ